MSKVKFLSNLLKKTEARTWSHWNKERTFSSKLLGNEMTTFLSYILGSINKGLQMASNIVESIILILVFQVIVLSRSSLRFLSLTLYYCNNIFLHWHAIEKFTVWVVRWCLNLFQCRLKTYWHYCQQLTLKCYSVYQTRYF